MYYHNPKTRVPKELMPGIVGRTFWGQKMLVTVVELAPHTELPRHSHPHEQLGYVIEGHIQFDIDGQVHILNPGEVFIIPGGVEHGAQTFDQPVKIFDVFSPVREEYKY